MSRRLVPCRACLRHVVAAEAVCPFCGAARAVDLGAADRVPPRLRRAATMAFATALVGCEPSKGPAAPAENAAEGAPSGAASSTATTTASATGTSVPTAPATTTAPTYDPGALKKPYGAPPVDGLLA